MRIRTLTGTWRGMAAAAASVLLGTALTGCGPDAEGRDLRPVQAVATTGMIADIVREVGGERVGVEALMGPGVDPHLYRASEGDVRRLADADVIFYNGLHLEAKMADVFERVARRKRTVAVAEAIDSAHLLAPPEFAGAWDPHVWMDVRLWMSAVERVRDALVDADPAGAGLYRERARRYLAALEELDGYARARLATVPPAQRVVITAHDAFNYFGRAYDVEVRGLQGISTVAEASASDVQALADFIAERRIPAIFVESSVPRRTVEAVQQAVRARGFDVAIGGQLFSDALGDAGTPEGTYVGMIRHNVDVIVGALRGETVARRAPRDGAGV